MQLFSLGLYKLNQDGSPVLDSSSNPVATYDNLDIVTMARVWTGFQNQATRSNIESPFGKGDSNNVDFCQINPSLRDLFPKTKLDSGFLGDGYPLCDSLPALHFLKPGARFRFTGNTSVEGAVMDAGNKRT
jgi:hypothetical protein